MKIVDIPFATTDWSAVPSTEHKGERGVAYWRTLQLGEIRVRIIEYSAVADGDAPHRSSTERGAKLFVVD